MNDPNNPLENKPPAMYFDMATAIEEESDVAH